MSILFALAAACSNAVSVATQHVASTADPEGPHGWRFVRYLLANPQWLLGWVALAGSFVFQSLALHDGLLSVVQVLLVTELVFSLVIRRIWIRQRVPASAWASATLTVAAVSLFISMAEPRGGSATPTSGAWASSILACAASAALLAVASLGGSPARRAALLGTATAVTWALEAAFIKAMTDTLSRDGWGMFTHWPVYAVAVGGLSGVLLEQAALHVGPLRISQPLLIIVDPMVSIVLSVHLFGEHFVESSLQLTLAASAFVAICAGVVLMARTVPETMERDLGPATTTR